MQALADSSHLEWDECPATLEEWVKEGKVTKLPFVAIISEEKQNVKVAIGLASRRMIWVIDDVINNRIYIELARNGNYVTRLYIDNEEEHFCISDHNSGQAIRIVNVEEVRCANQPASSF